MFAKPMSSAPPRHAAAPLRVVELFGLPGAGKTTLCNAIDQAPVDRTRRDLTQSWRRQGWRGRADVAMRSLRDVEWLAAVLSFALEKPLLEAESWRRLARLVAMKHRLRDHSGLVLLDQGVMQALWSIFYTEGKFDSQPSKVARLLRSFYAGVETRIVAIRVPEDIAARRVEGRTEGSSRLDTMPRETVLAQLGRTATLPDEILDAARLAGLDVEELDGRKSVAELAARMDAILGQLATPAR